MGKKAVKILIPVLGFLFLTAFIRSATVDVVYTDYMRLVNSYLPNVFSLSPYLHGDVLTRIPVNYIERIINVVFFGYSTTFDMILGAAGLTFAGILIASYMAKRECGVPVIIAVMIVVFSLDKWEMLTNGSGWVHFWAVALFIYNYIVFDRIRNGEEKKGDEARLIILPCVIIFLFAGPYCAVYFSAMFAVYVIDFIIARQKKTGHTREFIIRMIALVIPFIIYLISRSMSVEEYAGATDESFTSVLLSKPLYMLLLVVKSFAAVMIGGETATSLNLPQAAVIIIGLIVIAAYATAIVTYFKSGLYKKTYLPLVLMISGLASHGLIVLSRWIFMDDAYAMSSRYALQYMCGAVGIILTYAQTEKKTWKGIIIALLVAGQLITTGREIGVAPYRKEAFENMREVAANFENESDEELKSVLQYHDPDKTAQALTILKENGLNIWRTNTD